MPSFPAAVLRVPFLSATMWGLLLSVPVFAQPAAPPAEPPPPRPAAPRPAAPRPGAPAAEADDANDFKFRSAAPGVTTEQDLLDDSRWGTPGKQIKLDDGSVQWEYQLRGYKRVTMTMRGGRLQTIDVELPEGLGPAEAAQALRLGEPHETPPEPSPAALIGVPVPDNWDPIPYSAGRVVVYADRESGTAKLFRVYADKLIPTDGKPPVVAAARSAPALDTEAAAPVGALVPTEADRETMRIFARELVARHLSGHPLDDDIAQRTLEVYLDTLDYAKLIFTQQDVDGFRARYDVLDDQLSQGDLTFTFEIYDVYQSRRRERNSLYEELVAAPHDFTVDEWYLTDGSKATYAENDLEVREFWRKRVKHDLLAHKSTGADDAEARRRALKTFRATNQRLDRITSSDVTSWQAESLAGAYDPASSFIAAKELETYQIGLAGQLFGVGMQLQSTDGYVSVINVLPRGPAAREGHIAAGDRIVAVGQGDDGEMVDVVGMPLSEVVSMMRGERGATVKLRVLKPGEFEAAVYKLVRDKVDVSSFGSTLVTGETLPDRGGAKIGFIYLPTFYRTDAGAEEDRRSTTRDVERVLEEFTRQTVDVVVIDMRRNNGGSLTEAVNICGLFLGPEGTVLQVKGRDGNVEAYVAADIKLAWAGPLVLLTDRNSAGSPEIFAAAVQDYGRGLVVGDAKTHGLGTVANLNDLRPDGAANDAPLVGQLKVAIQKFYRANGASTQLRGVVPDVAFPSYNDTLKLGEETKLYPLKFDEVAAADIQRVDFGLDDKLIATLSQRSGERRAASPYFQELAKRLERYQQESEHAGEVNLQLEAYLASQRGEASAAADAPHLGDLVEVKLDGYLTEALAVSLDYAARYHFRRAEKLVGERKFVDALMAYTQSTAADPQYVDAYYKHAWLLSTCTDSSIRDGRNAVPLAQRACDLDNFKGWQYILGLAIAEAEARDFESANKHLKTALDAAPENQRAAFRYLEQRFQRKQTFSSR